jgi:hypothetical protein
VLASEDVGRVLGVHFWPKHGGDVFLEQEELARDAIYRLLYAHEGEFLDFNLPASYLARLRDRHASEKWDADEALVAAERGSAQGIAIANEFVLRLDAPATPLEDVQRWARLVQDPPHAVAAPEWNAASGVEGQIASRNEAQFPRAEETIRVHEPRKGLLALGR